MSYHLRPEDIINRYGPMVKLLERIFGAGNVHYVGDFSPNAPDGRGPLSISGWGQGAMTENAMPLFRRLAEYVGRRPFNDAEEAKEEQTRGILGFMDRAMALDPENSGENVVGHAGALNVPLAFLEAPDCAKRIEEFILGRSHESKGLATPDEAAVSLTAFTGGLWHVVYNDPPGYPEYRQLRIETETPVRDAEAVAQKLQSFLPAPSDRVGKAVFVDKTTQKLFIPAALLPAPEVMQALRTRAFDYEAPGEGTGAALH